MVSMSRHGYKLDYVRSSYSRGAMRTRDAVYEAVVAHNCVTCGKTLVRKYGRSGRPEYLQHFLKRKTCGRNSDGKATDCLTQNMLGEKNHSWNGGFPKCLICKKEIDYSTQKRKQRYCWDCWLPIFSQNTSIRQKALKGNFPEQFRNHVFKKGQKAWNKKFNTCQTRGCSNKHLARGMCSTHYQQWKKHETKEKI